MRLWHYSLIPILDNQRLLGQHRECCALRGKGWGKPHATVNYVFTHDYSMLFRYHYLVMNEMINRGYKVNPLWYSPRYRGQLIGLDTSDFTEVKSLLMYPEHNDDYLQKCIENIEKKKQTKERKKNEIN